MTTAVDKLTGLLDANDRYDIPPSELLAVQIEAAAERLATCRGTVQFLKHRIQSVRVDRIGAREDLVPLLFAHTAYKSYPESWLSHGRWDLLAKWLDTVSVYRVEDIDSRNVGGIDEWIERLATKGHYVCCSSGTTGKVSMINSAIADRAIVRRTMIASFEWATGIAAKQDRKLFICYPPTNNFRFLDSWNALLSAFGSGTEFRLPASPLTVGRVRAMVSLRKSIAEGTGRPSEIAAYEELAAERQREMDDAVSALTDALIASRDRKLLITGMYVCAHVPGCGGRAGEGLRALGFSSR